MTAEIFPTNILHYWTASISSTAVLQAVLGFPIFLMNTKNIQYGEWFCAPDKSEAVCTMEAGHSHDQDEISNPISKEIMIGIWIR